MLHGAPSPRHPQIAELPLSRAQESMWFLCRLAQDSSLYNLPSAVRFRGPLDVPALRIAFGAIVARHEILRTVFPAFEGNARQVVRPSIQLPLDLVDCSHLTADQQEARVRELAVDRPFDLTEGPLFRLTLLRMSTDEHVLLTVFHHLVWDGWSIGIFVGELAAHYAAARNGGRAGLPDLPIQYADFALWERGWLDGHLDKRIEYWRGALRGHGNLEVPTDRRRSVVPSHEGETLAIQLPSETAAALDRVSRDAETTPYRTLLAGFAALLGRWSGQERFALGTPVANRHQAEVTPLIGFFANLMPIPVDLGGDPSFAELLERTKGSTAGAFANQDIPFDSLVEGLEAGGDSSRNPIFQVVFALHQESLDGISLGDIAVEPVFLEADTTHFDLALHLWRRDGGVHGYFSYNTSLFERSTIARLGSHWITLLGAALADPHAPLSSLPLLGDEEGRWLLKRGTTEEVSVRRTVARTLADRAAAEPSRSLWSSGHSLDLDGLATAAREFARTLAQMGGTGHRIALATKTPDHQLAASWGAWQAGAVPIPLDPSETEARRAEILTLSRAGFIALDDDSGALVVRRVGAGSEEVSVGPAGRNGKRPAAVSLDSVAYISFAADPPVEVTHRHLAERMERLQRALILAEGDSVFGLSSAPDAFFLERFWPLLEGASLAGDPAQATLIHTTPSTLARLLESERQRPPGLHTILCSGGHLSVELAESARARFGCKVVYLYDPPEAATEVAVCRFEGTTAASSPSGQPTTALRILDDRGSLLPLGIPGTVWVGERATSDRARWRADGRLEILGDGGGRIWRDGVRHDLERVHRALLQDRSVYACHVAVIGGEICGYVVTSGLATRARIANSIPLPPALKPKILPVSTLPLDADGRVDEAALRLLPVLDDQLARRWEKTLSAVPGVEHARVVVRDNELEQRRTHLDGLVPGWRRRRTTDRTSTTTSAVSSALAGMDLPSSYCRGDELETPEGAPTTLVEAVVRAADRWGDERGLTIYETATDHTFLSYAHLVDRAQRVAAGLRAHGLERGDRVVLHVERLTDHFVALWGCIFAGVAPVGVTQAPAYDEKNAILSKLWNTWTLLRQPPILASGSLCGPVREAGRLYGASFRTLALEDLLATEAGLDASEADPEDVVFLQLTSGSTGVPKCIPETHRAIIAQVLAARQMHSYTDDDIGLNWLSLDHVVPLLTCHLRDTYLGLSQVHVRGQAVLVDPLLWLDLIAEHRVTLSWAPNFGFKLVNDALAKHPGRTWDLSSLRWVMNAGEQVTLPVSAAWVRNLAPFGVRPEVLQPGYGMAEVSTAVTYANDFTPEGGAWTVRKDSLSGLLVDATEAGPDAITFVDVGPPIPGVELHVTSADGDVLPESVIGQVQVRGRVTMPGYLYNDDANAEAFPGDGWFDTGDLGFIRGGRLTVTGRTKEIIIVRGANFYCYEVEEVVNNTPGVRSTFAAACAMDDPLTGTEGLAVFFVPEKDTSKPDGTLLRAIRQNVTKEFGVAPSYVIPMAHESFPKTTSGKIQRTQLKNRLAAGEFDDTLRAIDLIRGMNAVPAWFLEWDWRTCSPTLSGRRSEGHTLVVDTGMGPRDASTSTGLTPSPLAHELIDALGSGRASLVRAEAIGEALDTARAGGRTVDTVFALEPSPARLLMLAQGLASEEHIRLVIGVTHALPLPGCHDLVPERTALRGLAETIPLEFEGIDTSMIDVTLATDPAARLVMEARALSKDRVVAYRSDRRLVPLLRPARFGSTESPLSEGDLVVVTGGLGGVGGELCKHLMLRYGVRLLVTGRSSIEADDESAIQEGLAQRKDNAERRETLRELDAIGDVLYRRVDVTDRTGMAGAVREAEQLFGTDVRAGLHLAGIFPPRLLAEETPESLSATLAPKLEGARCLNELLPPDGLLLLFGSVYGAFGAAACGGYAAANAALEGFAASREGPTRLMAWSNWSELGMSRGYALGDSSRALGFEMIGRRDGLDSFDAALHAESDSILLGVDSRSPNVSRYLDEAPQGLQHLLAYYSGSPDAVSLAGLRVPDAGGQLTRCSFFEVPEMPLDEAGAVDLSRLEWVCRAAGADAVLPGTSAERTVAAIWRDVLEIDIIDVDANFFSVGGQSILLLQVLAKLEQSFGREIAVVDLFRYPTVRSLAAFLGEAAPEKRSFDAAADRARRQRAARRPRRRPRGLR
jgi:acyl-CoA synthetase (AMP-forming)/AMP-acid ligase II/acyl carrier protein/NADP-dependent 3-hydroxy acid dehydrogenase YdfG